MRRRLMLKNASGGGFEPYIITTPFTLTEHGLWYLTPIDTSEGAVGNSIMFSINNGRFQQVTSSWMLGGINRKFKIEFLNDGTLNFYSPALNQYYGELATTFSDVDTFAMRLGWSDPGTSKRYRVDIDESRWGVLE